MSALVYTIECSLPLYSFSLWLAKFLFAHMFTVALPRIYRLEYQKKGKEITCVVISNAIGFSLLFLALAIRNTRAESDMLGVAYQPYPIEFYHNSSPKMD